MMGSSGHSRSSLRVKGSMIMGALIEKYSLRYDSKSPKYHTQYTKYDMLNITLPLQGFDVHARTLRYTNTIGHSRPYFL
jgi:hypothetical protein